MYSELENLIVHLAANGKVIPQDRLKLLHDIATYIGKKQRDGEPVKLNFICTENSRRSHLSQLLAAALAHHFNLPIKTYSGGTVVSACNPRTIAALKRAGFAIENPGGENPKYVVRFAVDAEPILAYSKLYDAPENPQDSFIAVMVCGSADKNCPFIPNAEKRFALTFDDPKVADDTPDEAATYDAKIIEIGTQLYYLFNLVKNG